MKTLHTLLLGAALLASVSLSGPAFAQAPTPPNDGTTADAPASATAAEMTEGEVRKVDAENKKLTLRHGEIKNLGMPGMTMVFQVSDPAMLDKVKTGDKVRFTAEKVNGAITVTRIETGL